MMVIIPEGINVEPLQAEYPIIDWEIYTDDFGEFWKIIRVGDRSEVYKTFEDLVKGFERDDFVKM